MTDATHWFSITNHQTIHLNMFENDNYTFFVESKNDSTTDLARIVAHKKDSPNSYECILQKQDVIMPFTSIKHLIMFFKCGISCANNFTCNISADEGLVVTIANFASLYEITKTFAFVLVNDDVEMDRFSDMNAKQLDELVKTTREQIVKILCDHEFWRVWLNTGYVTDEKEIKYKKRQMELCYKKGTKLQDFDNSKPVKWWGDEHNRLQGVFTSGHYVKMLHELDTILNGFVHDFATFYEDNRFMNCYRAFLDMMDEVRFDGNPTEYGMTTSMQQLIRTICNHYAMKQFEPIFPTFIFDIRPPNCNACHLYVFEMSKKLVGIVAEFIRTLFQHYSAKN